MKANVKGSLMKIDLCWKGFEHKGLRMTREQVVEILVFCILKGFINTSQLTDVEVEDIINL